MAVTLTTNAKDWIAQNLGIGNCMTETAQSFTYRDSVNNINIPDSGGTATILNRLIDSLVPYVTIGGTQYTYAALKTQNNNVELVYPDDVQWVMANDAGAAQYCVGVTPTPPAPTPGGTTETPPFEVVIVEGKPCPAGAPDVLLDTGEAFAYFKAEPLLYVGVMKIDVTNRDLTGNECYAYFAWEMRMWPGPAGTTCPTTTPAHQTISRFLGEVSAKKVISVKLLGANEKAMIGGSFEIPSHFRGKYTLCLSLWGNFSKTALLAELAAAGYAEEIPW